MTIRMSDVVPEPEPDPIPHWDGPPQGLKNDTWPECEFEGCTNPSSFMMKDRFGQVHRSCTDDQDALDQWVREHNGWDVPAGAGGSDGGGEGTKEDGSG